MKKYQYKKILLIVLIIIYMAVGYLVTKYEVENLSIPAGSVLMGSVYGVPVIIIMWLRECINTLIALKMDVKAAMESQEGRKKIMRYKGIMWGLSIIILRVLSYSYIHISYLMQIEKNWLVGLILITILLFWLILSIWYEKHLEVVIHRDERKKKFVRGCICIVLVLFTLIGYDYVEKKIMRNGTESWWSHIIKSIPKTNTLFLQKNVPFCIYIVVGMYLYYDNGFCSRKGSGAEIAGNIIYWMMS